MMKIILSTVDICNQSHTVLCILTRLPNASNSHITLQHAHSNVIQPKKKKRTRKTYAVKYPQQEWKWCTGQIVAMVCSLDIKAGMVHSNCELTCGWQVKLCILSLMCAIPERAEMNKDKVLYISMFILLYLCTYLQRRCHCCHTTNSYKAFALTQNMKPPISTFFIQYWTTEWQGNASLTLTLW